MSRCEDGTNECQLLVSPLTQSPIRGEVNLLRYLARFVSHTILLPLLYIFCRLYPAALSHEGPDQDEHLDNVHRFEGPYNTKKEILLSYNSTTLLTCSYRLYWGAARSRAATLHQLTSNVSEKKNLAGGKPGASDFALYSALVNLNLQGDLSAEVYF